MKYTNKNTVESLGTPIWRETEDGFLRCTARVQQENILDYGLDELELLPKDFDKSVVKVLIPESELSHVESIGSLEGAPVVSWEHSWMTPTSVSDGSVGSVAGTPVIKNGFLVCDMLITDEPTIKQIKNGDIGEISAAYYAETIFDPGVFQGREFDARQNNIRYNHIAIIPKGSGRAGSDVRITNNKKEITPVSNDLKLIRIQGQRTKKVLNMDEESVVVYNEEQDLMEKASDTVKSEAEAYKKELDELRSRYEVLQGELAAYKQQVDNGSDDTAVEKAALAMLEDQKDAHNIISRAKMTDTNGHVMSSTGVEQYMNSIRKLNGDKLKLNVLSRLGMNTDNMSKDVIKGAWSAQKHICKQGLSQVAGSKMLNSNNQSQNQPGSRSAFDRLGGFDDD